jgi:hypothetical protein
MDHVPYVHLRKMVDFFYSTDYDEDLLEVANTSVLQLHAQMFLLADQYDIPGLLFIAAKKFRARCVNSWNALEFLHSIRDLYKLTPSSIIRLRETACVVIRGYLPEMLDDAMTAECFEKTVLEVPEFAKDLLQGYIDRPLMGYCDTCRCNQSMECLQTRCQNCNKGQGGRKRMRISSGDSW